MPSYRVPPGVCGDLDGSVPIKAENPTQAIDKLRKKFIRAGLRLVARRVTIFGLQISRNNHWHQVAALQGDRVHRR